MNFNGANRRRNMRYPCSVETAVELNANGKKALATTTNQSVSGVYLHFATPVHLAIGDRVTCEFRFQPDSGVPLPNWGMGNIVRIDGSSAGIQLSAGSFIPVSRPTNDDDQERGDRDEPAAS